MMEVEALRRDTPGCQDLIHLANAGAALQPTPVVRAVAEHLASESRLGGYEAQVAAFDRLAAGRSALGAVIGAPAESVAYQESGTLAWWRTLGIVAPQPGDRVLVTSPEYLGTVLPLRQLSGVEVVALPDGPDGALDLDATAAALRGRPHALVMCHAASHLGVVNDVTAVGRLLRTVSPDTWFVVDACQSAGQVRVDVSEIDCDLLVGTGRKWLRGPRGSAFLFAGPRAQRITPFPLDATTGHLDEAGRPTAAPGIARFEPWEQSWAAQLGLGAAAEYLRRISPDDVFERIGTLAGRAREALRSIPEVVVHDRGRVSGGIVSFSHDRVPASAIVAAARAERINVGLPSPVSAPLDGKRRDPVRLSAHVYNTEAEVDTFTALVAAL